MCAHAARPVTALVRLFIRLSRATTPGSRPTATPSMRCAIAGPIFGTSAAPFPRRPDHGRLAWWDAAPGRPAGRRGERRGWPRGAGYREGCLDRARLGHTGATHSRGTKVRRMSTWRRPGARAGRASGPPAGLRPRGASGLRLSGRPAPGRWTSGRPAPGRRTSGRPAPGRRTSGRDRSRAHGSLDAADSGLESLQERPIPRSRTSGLARFRAKSCAPPRSVEARWCSAVPRGGR